MTMRRTMQISLGAIGLILVIFSILIGVPSNHNAPVTPTSYPITSLFSKDADKAFVSSFTGGTDLNSGITMEQARSAIPEQANNITFAVFNHTDEPILFEDQGFGITIFRYDDTHKLWERLQLQYTPYRELRTLPPKLERWDLDINNTWSVSEDETTASGAEKLRLYISGTGQTTNKIYGAYLDVPVISFQRETAQHSVHPTGGSLRVFRQFAWLEAGSGKVALSRPTHQRVTQTVRRLAK
jgi:hypothetical protein